MIVQAFLSALADLTLLRLPSTRGPVPVPYRLICYPLVGFLFGLLGLIVVSCLHLRLPHLSAYLVFLIWVGLSGAAHLRDSFKLLSEVLPVSERDQSAWTIVFLIQLGKILALLQLQILDAGSAALTVLLTPVLSRYSALLLAVSGEVAAEYRTLAGKGKAVLGASLITAALSLVSLPLAAGLLASSMIAAMIVRWIALRRTGSDAKPVYGFCVELVEMVMLWVPCACAAAGVNLAALRLF